MTIYIEREDLDDVLRFTNASGEEDGHVLVVYDGLGRVIARFDVGRITAWWMDDQEGEAIEAVREAA